MIKFLQWLGKNKYIAILISAALYLSIVYFHEDVTRLAIKMRNAIGRDSYNAYLAYGFLLIMVSIFIYLLKEIITGKQKWLKALLVLITAGMTAAAFRTLMVYSIEAIHFVEYMVITIILLTALRSYGETVFWVTILGLADELYQYFVLTPDFEYFDFNDVTLNLIGAAWGAVFVYILGGKVIEIRRYRWYASPAVITGIVLLVLFTTFYLTGKVTLNPAVGNWFSLNRQAMPDVFWMEAYKGRFFHLLLPYESLLIFSGVFSGFVTLDYFINRAGVKQ